MHCVIETEAFASDVKGLGIKDDFKHEMISAISNDPQSGDVISGTGGARKMRFALPGKARGKSAGVRVVWYYAADDVPVYLLAVFDKGEKINLSKHERNELRKELTGIAEDYRSNVKQRVAELKRQAS